MAGLCTPLPTLRRRPYGRLRTARGRCGSLLLHRKGLAPSTPCRSPGALRNPSHYRTHRTQCPLPSVSLTAPVHRGLLQFELLHQEIGTIAEIIERGAGPIRGLARRRVAIAPCSDTFAGAEHIAGTNGFLRIGGVNRARLVEAPGPGRTGRAFQ